MAIRRSTESPGLRLEVVDWLLDGHVRGPDEAAKLEGYDVWIEFDPPTDLNLRETWRQHRAELMREWRRRGGEGEPWGAQFDEGASR